MHSYMQAEAYIDSDWFVRERQLLMTPLWQFVAPRMLLSKHNAFVTRNVCGINVVVQNFNGEIRAFENLCLHRSNPLQQQSNGVRPLVCSYHGWSYKEDGAIDNIPFEETAYRFSGEERQCLRLRAFPVEFIGPLVFVNVSYKPLPFEEQFQLEALDSLREASMMFDSEVLVATIPCHFNWKLAYENLRDSLHPRFLHQQTVYQLVKFQLDMPDETVANAKAYHAQGSSDRGQHLQMLRTFSSGGLNEPIAKMPHFAWHDYVERYGRDDWYLNWLVFPNLHIASGSGGHSFIIEHHQPISAGRTDLTVYYVTARKKRRYATSAAVLMSNLEGAERVLREDIDIMEKVQSGLRAGAPRAQLGDFEHANINNQRWYFDVIEGRHAL